MTNTLRVLQLYPHAMNIYGDWGNTLTVLRRAQWHGYDVDLVDYNPGDQFPSAVDILIGGGGQDSGQEKVHDDLIALGPQLRAMAADGIPMLAVCGLYQLFGNYFETVAGRRLDGISIFDLQTHGGSQRLIGNIVTRSDEFGDIVGYENHSGKTVLGQAVAPLGTVVKGAGNNGDDHTEGARIHNVIGTYLHGSLLPKNPKIADKMIQVAAEKKFGSFIPGAINDALTDSARSSAISRPR